MARRMDTLSDILNVLQLQGALYFRTAFSPPWSVAVPPLGRAARFHLVAQGQCCVRIGSNREVNLNAGDLIVIPNGKAHILCDSRESVVTPLEDVLKRSGFSGTGVLVYGGDPEPNTGTQLICGHMAFAESASHPLLRAFPDCLIVTAETRARAPWLDELMRLITQQMFLGPPGVAASVIRLSEALFIEIIRTCASQDGALRRILEAIDDPRIGRALSLMHKSFDQDWTLDRMAREIGMSRSRFADRFQALMGSAPMTYLWDLRLQKALNLLSCTASPIQTVAAQVGYQSPAAFSRAFSTRYGHSPSDHRRATM